MSLYDYQKVAATHLAEAIQKHRAVLDASDTGVGKTFVALGVAHILGVTPLVICPKSVRTAWRTVAETLGVEIIDAINIEKLKAGNTPYLKKSGKTFVWRLPPRSLVIWDECQNASGYRSQNGKILALTKAYKLNVLMLSATAAETPLKMRAIGYLLGLHKYKDHYSWCLNHGCYKNQWDGLEFTRATSASREAMGKIHAGVFPDKGNRISIKDLDVFPENSVFAEAYDLDEYTDQINEIYLELEDNIKDPEREENPLVMLLRARQQTEMFKVPLIRDMTSDLIDEGKKVVIFVNFRETLDSLVSHVTKFGGVSTIYGGQSSEERDDAIASFQQTDRPIMVAMIQAGGVGISLHDTTGDYPRVSLITPNFSAVQMKQALGRIHRAGGKSKCIQRILFAANTVEEQACKSVRRKLDNLSMLNDGDLTEGILDN